VRASPDDRAARLQAGAGALGVRLDAGGAARLVAYLDLLYQANRTLNLTRVAPDAALELHGVDSLAGLRVLADPELLVADVGTGGGFPGVALAAARPAWRVTVVDSVQKKVQFVREAVQAAGIANVTAVWGRAEDLGRRPDFRERFDAAVARALAALPVLLELALPLVRPGGRVVAYKGGDVDEEVAASAAALQALGGAVEAVDRFRLPWSGAPRSLVVVRKTGSTPSRYPRRAGIPHRRPLGGPAGAPGRGQAPSAGLPGAPGAAAQAAGLGSTGGLRAGQDDLGARRRQAATRRRRGS